MQVELFLFWLPLLSILDHHQSIHATVFFATTQVCAVLEPDQIPRLPRVFLLFQRVLQTASAPIQVCALRVCLGVFVSVFSLAKTAYIFCPRHFVCVWVSSILNRIGFAFCLM